MYAAAAYARGTRAAQEAFGLTKEAAVPTPVKMYRRSMQMLAGRQKSYFHGSSSPEKNTIGGSPLRTMQSIMSQGQLNPSTGAHNKGVYLWNDLPLQTYLNRANSYGVSFRKDQVGSFRQPKDPRPNAPVRRQVSVFHSPDKVVPAPLDALPLRLPEGKETTVFAPGEGLAALQPLFKKTRHRQMDSAIFNRAEADWRARQHANAGRADPVDIPRPTHKDLEQQRANPVVFPKLRAATDDSIDEFMQNYLSRVPKPQPAPPGLGALPSQAPL